VVTTPVIITPPLPAAKSDTVGVPKPYARQPHPRGWVARAQAVHGGEFVGVEFMRSRVYVYGDELPLVPGPDTWPDLTFVQLIAAPRELLLAVPTGM
jgi:hypothetical protein